MLYRLETVSYRRVFWLLLSFTTRKDIFDSTQSRNKLFADDLKFIVPVYNCAGDFHVLQKNIYAFANFEIVLLKYLPQVPWNYSICNGSSLENIIWFIFEYRYECFLRRSDEVSSINSVYELALIIDLEFYCSLQFLLLLKNRQKENEKKILRCFRPILKWFISKWSLY